MSTGSWKGEVSWCYGKKELAQCLLEQVDGLSEIDLRYLNKRKWLKRVGSSVPDP